MAKRTNIPELWGWAEFLVAADRTDTALRYMRNAYDDFPEPVAQLSQGPIYVAKDCREFIKGHPKLPAAHAHTVKQQVFKLRDQGTSVRDISVATEIPEPTIYRWLKRRAKEGGQS